MSHAAVDPSGDGVHLGGAGLILVSLTREWTLIIEVYTNDPDYQIGGNNLFSWYIV